MSQDHQRKMQNYRKNKEAVYIEKDRIEDARSLAAALDYRVSRGMGVGQGNTGELIHMLVRAYRRDPDGVIAALKELQDETPTG